MTFEEKLKKLESLVAKLEDETIGLDETIKLYNEAKELSASLNNELNESIKKMSFIVEGDKVVPFDVEENAKKDI